MLKAELNTSRATASTSPYNTQPTATSSVLTLPHQTLDRPDHLPKQIFWLRSDAQEFFPHHIPVPEIFRLPNSQPMDGSGHGEATTTLSSTLIRDSARERCRTLLDGRHLTFSRLASQSPSEVDSIIADLEARCRCLSLCHNHWKARYLLQDVIANINKNNDRKVRAEKSIFMAPWLTLVVIRDLRLGKLPTGSARRKRRRG